MARSNRLLLSFVTVFLSAITSAMGEQPKSAVNSNGIPPENSMMNNYGRPMTYPSPNSAPPISGTKHYRCSKPYFMGMPKLR